MSQNLKNILVIGGGFSGMTAAIQLSKLNYNIDLVEIDENWRSDGAGISIGGATLRAFHKIGILEEFLEKGHAHNGLEVYAPHGQHLAHVPTPPMSDTIPGSAAIMRPELAKILAKKTSDSKTNVRLGCTFTDIIQKADAVEVTFTDGTTQTYDLVIGADGVSSQVRKTVFPEAASPKYVGQGVWRAVLPRLAEINNTQMWVGKHLKVGVNPMSKNDMYLFLTENKKVKQREDKNQYVSRLKDLMLNFSAPTVQQLAGMLSENSLIDFRALDNLLVPLPWFKKRVVMIGDTVHATTPHLASGACIGIEDAIVLAEELEKNSDVTAALDAYQTRRWERCKMVVENSGRLAQIEIDGGDKEEHTTIMRESMMALSNPI